MAEEELPGGFVNVVVRAGDTVRRTRSPNAAFVERLLTHFEQCGWAGAHRFLGVVDRDREVLSYVDGHVAWRPHGHSVESLAAPGERVHDVAHVCWQYVALGPGGTDPAGAARNVRAIADAYGLSDRSALIDTILWWQDRCWRGIEAEASAGVEAAVRLRGSGVVQAIQDQYARTASQRPVLDAALRE